MSWYRVSVNMGDEPIDALANFAARILPAYSGVNTCYGLVSLGVAFMAVILVVCKRYAWAAAVGIAGVALAVAAMFFTPDFVELNTYVGGGGDDSVADLLRSDVVSGMLPDDVRNGAKMASDVLDVVYGYVAVKSCFGLKVYAVTSAAFAALRARGLEKILRKTIKLCKVTLIIIEKIRNYGKSSCFSLCRPSVGGLGALQERLYAKWPQPSR